MRPEDFQHSFFVSRETMERLEIYHALLLKWQKAINLVSDSTLEYAWERHFSDSAQLVQYIPESTKTIMDLGSGAGFPGLVLAIMRPDIEAHLVESDERKGQFLRTVSRETNTNIILHNSRIEEVVKGGPVGKDPVGADPVGKGGAFVPDIVTARALADLSRLCEYCLPWAEKNPALAMLFLKGERAASEIAAAQQKYQFQLEIYPSSTAADGAILHLRGLSLRG